MVKSIDDLWLNRFTYSWFYTTAGRNLYPYTRCMPHLATLSSALKLIVCSFEHKRLLSNGFMLASINQKCHTDTMYGLFSGSHWRILRFWWRNRRKTCQTKRIYKESHPSLTNFLHSIYCVTFSNNSFVYSCTKAYQFCFVASLSLLSSYSPPSGGDKHSPIGGCGLKVFVVIWINN